MSLGFLPSSLLFYFDVIADIFIVEPEFERENLFDSIFPFFVFASWFGVNGARKVLDIDLSTFVSFFRSSNCFRSPVFLFDTFGCHLHVSNTSSHFRASVKPRVRNWTHIKHFNYNSLLSGYLVLFLRLSAIAFLSKMDSIQYQHRMHIATD